MMISALDGLENLSDPIGLSSNLIVINKYLGEDGLEYISNPWLTNLVFIKHIYKG